MKPQAQPKRLIIRLPQRKCLNCGAPLPQGHKYQTCSFRCHQQQQAMLAAIDKADKEAEYPF